MTDTEHLDQKAPRSGIYHPLPPESQADNRQFPTKYAKFEARAMASILDGSWMILLSTPFTYLSVRTEASKDVRDRLQEISSELLKLDSEAIEPELLQQLNTLRIEKILVEAPTQFATFIPIILILFICLKYFGSSPGKWLLGLRVVNAEDGGPLTTRQAIGRIFAYPISMLPLMLGVLWINFNRKRKGWHDMLASTVVLDCKWRYLSDLRKRRKEMSKASQN